MNLVTTYQDQLDIDLVKKHLVVDHTDDDPLIESYITASIGYIEAYIHERILDETYESDPQELILINMKYRLRLPADPKQLIVKVGNHPEQIPHSAWEYKNGYLEIEPVSHINPTAFVALVGMDPRWIDSVNQARLMLIGQFYNYRESIADLKIMELPTGVRFLLDNITGASI